jgi:hypothetical protein
MSENRGWGLFGSRPAEESGGGNVATEENWQARAEEAERKLNAVLELTRQAARRGAISREDLRQVEDAAGVERPAPRTLTITLAVEGDTDGVPWGQAGPSIEDALRSLASRYNLEIVRGSAVAEVANNG